MPRPLGVDMMVNGRLGCRWVLWSCFRIARKDPLDVRVPSFLNADGLWHDRILYFAQSFGNEFLHAARLTNSGFEDFT